MKTISIAIFSIILLFCSGGCFSDYRFYVPSPPIVGKVLSKECVAGHWEHGMRYSHGIGGWKHRWTSWHVSAKYYLQIFIANPQVDNSSNNTGTLRKVSVSSATYEKLNVGDTYDERNP